MSCFDADVRILKDCIAPRHPESRRRFFEDLGFGFPCSTSSAEMISRKAFRSPIRSARRQCSNDGLMTPGTWHACAVQLLSHSATPGNAAMSPRATNLRRVPLSTLESGNFRGILRPSMNLNNSPLFIPKPRMKLSAIGFPTRQRASASSACSCPESMMTPSQSKIAAKGGEGELTEAVAAPAARNFFAGLQLPPPPPKQRARAASGRPPSR